MEKTKFHVFLVNLTFYFEFLNMHISKGWC